MWYRGLMLVCSIVLVASANAQQQQQQDTTKHGWGIVYSSPKSRATATPAQGITPTTPPAPSTQSQVTTLPTIRGTPPAPPASTPTPAPSYAPAPAYTPAPPANGVYMGDRPPASAPTVAAQGTYDTVPPASVSATSGGGVHLDELMSLHEYTSTGLTNLKPQEVQALEIWLQRYRASLIDSLTRATPAAAAPAPAPVANTRALPATNVHTVAGIRSGSRFIQIDDGSVWDIYPADQTETANWQVGDNVTVRVATQAYGEFDHELVNSQRTGPVRAKFMGYARSQ